jgi:hypothetical protein
VQLRDAQTSELIADGTPLEIATAAADMDAADILFDDCGGVDRDGRSLFDPAAVRKQRADEIAGLQAVLDDPGTPQEQRDTLRGVIKERRDRIAAGKAKVPGAKQAMSDARARVEKRRGG